jgi:hypothetical protein
MSSRSEARDLLVTVSFAGADKADSSSGKRKYAPSIGMTPIKNRRTTHCQGEEPKTEKVFMYKSFSPRLCVSCGRYALSPFNGSNG